MAHKLRALAVLALFLMVAHTSASGVGNGTVIQTVAAAKTAAVNQAAVQINQAITAVSTAAAQAVVAKQQFIASKLTPPPPPAYPPPPGPIAQLIAYKVALLQSMGGGANGNGNGGGMSKGL